MPILVGTVVKPYVQGDMDDHGCGLLVSDEMAKVDECLGIVLELGDTEAKVHWLHFCRYHINETPTHNWEKYDNLWEIGQAG